MTTFLLNDSLGQFDAATDVSIDGQTTIGERIAQVLLAYSDTQKAIADDYAAGGIFDYGFLSGTQAYVNLDGYRIVLDGTLSFPNLNVTKIAITRLADNAQLVLGGSFVYSGVPTVTELPNGSRITSIDVREGAEGASLRLDATYSGGQVTGTVTSVITELFGVPWNTINPSGRWAEHVDGSAQFTLSGVATNGAAVAFGAANFSELLVGTFEGTSQSFLDYASITDASVGLDEPTAAFADFSGADVVHLTGGMGIDLDAETGADSVDGSPGPDFIELSDGNDTASGNHGDDTLDGGLGTDFAGFSGSVSEMTVELWGQGVRVTDGVAGRDGVDLLTRFERLQFEDMGINLTVQSLASSIPQAALDRICELYVGFFGRVPAANGLENWINQFKGGKSLDRIADDFYGIGSSEALREYTGYWDFANNRELSDQDYVRIVYRNVLGREGLEAGINYWAGQLASGPDQKTRGELVSTMLDAAHGLKPNPDWGWVATLLDDRITMSKLVAMEWGLNYARSDQEAIEKGMAIAGAVDESPNPNPAYASIPVKIFDFDAATELVGVNPDHLHLIT